MFDFVNIQHSHDESWDVDIDTCACVDWWHLWQVTWTSTLAPVQTDDTCDRWHGHQHLHPCRLMTPVTGDVDINTCARVDWWHLWQVTWTSTHAPVQTDDTCDRWHGHQHMHLCILWIQTRNLACVSVCQILTSLVHSIRIPVTCKIRILPSVSNALLLIVICQFYKWLTHSIVRVDKWSMSCCSSQHWSH